VCLQHKAKTSTLQVDIDEMYEKRSQQHVVKEKLKSEARTAPHRTLPVAPGAFTSLCPGCCVVPLRLQIGSLEGGIHATEREIRELSQTSALKDGVLNFDVAKKKRRLNSDLESLLDRLQVKRKEFLDLDARCLHCPALRLPEF
jgi:hypothetical protein